MRSRHLAAPERAASKSAPGSVARGRPGAPRWLFSAFVALLVAWLAVSSGHGQADPRVDVSGLDARIDAILAEHGEGVEASVWIGGAEGGPWYARRAGVWRPAASSIKSAYLVELFAARAGRLDDVLEGASEVVGDPEHPAVAHFDADTRAEIRRHLSRPTVRDVGAMMIRSRKTDGEGVSNAVYNAAANVVTAVLGGPRGLTERIRSRHPDAAGFEVRRYMLAARDVTGDNELQAASLARVLQGIARRDLPGVDPQTVEAIREVLFLEDDPALGAHHFKGGALNSEPLARIRSGFFDGGDATVVYVMMAEQAGPGSISRAEAGERLEHTCSAVAEAVLAAFPGGGERSSPAAGTERSPSALQSEHLPERDYRVYVAAESDDTVALVRFGPGGMALDREIPVGSFPAEIEGPHGVAVSPDGRHWFVTIAHGFPFGSLHKYEAGSDEWVGDATLGMFPATVEVSPSTGLAFVVNFDVHGDMEPGTVSVVETSTMTEVAQIPTGIMPHGSRLSRDGMKQYHVAMMDDELVEIDALRFEVSRVLRLSEAAHVAPVVKPTWVTNPTRDGRVYVAGNGDSVIYEVELEDWAVTRRFPTLAAGDNGRAPYNLDVTPDGRWLVATYKGGHAVGIWDLEAGTEHARIPTTRRVPHGVVITPDARYAFVSVEGVGGEPGAVEVYDIAAGARVGAVDVGKQAGGIAFWR